MTQCGHHVPCQPGPGPPPSSPRSSPGVPLCVAGAGPRAGSSQSGENQRRPAHPHLSTPDSPARCPGGTGCLPSPSLGSAAGSGPGLPHSLRTGAGSQGTHHLLHAHRVGGLEGHRGHILLPWLPSGISPASTPRPIVSLKISYEGRTPRRPQMPGLPECTERTPWHGMWSPESRGLGQARHRSPFPTRRYPQPPTSRSALHRGESSSGRFHSQPPASTPGPQDCPPPNLLGSEHHDDSGHPPHCQLWAHSRGTGVSHLLSEPEERTPRPELPLTPLPPRRTGPAQDPERGGRKDGDQVSGHPLTEGPPECWGSSNLQGSTPCLGSPGCPGPGRRSGGRRPRSASPTLCPGHDSQLKSTLVGPEAPISCSPPENQTKRHDEGRVRGPLTSDQWRRDTGLCSTSNSQPARQQGKAG